MQTMKEGKHVSAVMMILMAAVVSLLAGERERGGEKLEKVAFLGVRASAADEALREQVGLPQGVGLVVNDVEPNSPAAARLHRHDVLHKLNDQILVNPQQLAVLVRLHNPGDKIVLTVIRKGKSVKVEAVLGERELPPVERDAPGWLRLPIQPPTLRFGWPTPESRQELFEKIREELEGFGITHEKFDRIFDQITQWSRHGLPRRGEGHGPGARQPDTRPGGDPPSETGGTRILPGSVTTLTDGYTLTVTTDRDGNRRLYAVDQSGKVLFDGPINSPEEIEKVPENLRNKLEDILETIGVVIPEFRKKQPDERRGVPDSL